jgi:hypothetical protein
MVTETSLVRLVLRPYFAFVLFFAFAFALIFSDVKREERFQWACHRRNLVREPSVRVPSVLMVVQFVPYESNCVNGSMDRVNSVAGGKEGRGRIARRKGCESL